MADRRKAASNPRKYGARRRDYPQGKQKKETGLARERPDLPHLTGVTPAGQNPGTPRHAGIRAKKKGLETIQTLVIGGGKATELQRNLQTHG